MVYDSNFEKKAIEDDPMTINQDKVTVFAKLPRISIPTPYKAYNPDFAYLIDRGDHNKQLFLVVEAKGYRNASDIPTNEQTKIDYAEKFFKALQDQMPEIDVHFEKRINQQQLSEILANIGTGK